MYFNHVEMFLFPLFSMSVYRLLFSSFLFFSRAGSRLWRSWGFMIALIWSWVESVGIAVCGEKGGVTV